jgi:PAS domain S-box-containing protein
LGSEWSELHKMRDHPTGSPSAQALLVSEERFRLLVDAVVDYAIYMLDLDGNVSSWNSGAQRIKGYSAEEIIGQHFSKFYAPEDVKIGLPARGLKTAAEEGRFEAEGWRVRCDGTKFWANVVIDAVKDDDGRLIGFAKVTRDLTERLRSQEALEKTRQQLHQAQKLEALGQLSGGVAHDFNNMLTAIISNLQMVQGSVSLQGVPHRQIEAALQAARNGAAVVRQMLVFARKQSIQPIEFKVRDALEEVSALIRRSCHANVRVEMEFSPDAEWVIAEPSQLQTSVLNLVLNGCDAMPEGGTLKVSTSKRRIAYNDILPPGEYVCITVSDTGTGMTSDVLDHALEPFFTTKEVGKGTGLGLSTVYGAVRQFGGDVKITSVPGEGTKVELLLPAGTGASIKPMEDLADTSAELKNGEPSPVVLYVEDDFLVGMATMDLLESEGYRVLSAPRADVALKTLEANPDIALLLTDIGLPGMNGHELVAEARRRHGPIRTVFLTGYDRTGPRAGTASDTITKYVDKPYDPKALARLVREIISTPLPGK